MSSKKNNVKKSCAWASVEFGNVNLGDERLRKRLIKLADSLAESPESPINQACDGWAEAKGAYRFFQNESVNEKEILASHTQQTVERAKNAEKILAIQDTSYICYSKHKQTTGLGMITKKPGSNATTISTTGVIMHTTFAVTTSGLPLGILDQNISARKPLSDQLRQKKKKGHNTYVPIEDKESIRWLDSLRRTQEATKDSDIEVVTICDREGDFYELFEHSKKIGTSVLVRASVDRIINKSSMYTRKLDTRLWGYVQSLPVQGTIEVEIPARNQRPARTATLETRFGSFKMNPPRNLFRQKTEDLPDIGLNAVYVTEKDPPQGEDALEWMLLTDLPVTDFDEAIEKVRWYCLRWRIEVFHKILKSGLKVEQCRLQTADGLIRYLTVMSIIAWRIYRIELIF